MKPIGGKQFKLIFGISSKFQIISSFLKEHATVQTSKMFKFDRRVEYTYSLNNIRFLCVGRQQWKIACAAFMYPNILHIHRIESYLYAFRWKVYIENVKFRIWSVEKPTEKLCRYWWTKVMWKSKHHNYKLHIQKKIITDTVCVCYMSVCIHTNGKYVQLKDRSLVQNIIGRQSQKREKCRLQEAISIECNRVVHKRYERTLTEINRQCFGMPQASDRELIIEIILYVIIWCSEVISITIIWFKVCKNVCI